MRIYMAAAENGTYLRMLHEMGAKNILMSFFYLRGRKHEKIVEMLTYARSFADSIFLDSGAHTLIVAFGEDKKKGNFRNSYRDTLNMEEYIKDYLDFITKYHSYFDSIAELDIAICPGVGYERVKQWREYMKKLGLINKMIVVLHYKHFTQLLGQWEDEWRNILREYPKLALGDGPQGYTLKRIFDIWKEEGHNNKIHGFAETKLSKLQRVPYYSVDSTSRQIGIRYNQYLMFKNGKLLHMNAKDWRQKYGVDLAKLSKEEKIKMCYKAYRDMEDYTTKLQKAKGIVRDD